MIMKSSVCVNNDRRNQSEMALRSCTIVSTLFADLWKENRAHKNTQINDFFPFIHKRYFIFSKVYIRTGIVCCFFFSPWHSRMFTLLMYFLYSNEKNVLLTLFSPHQILWSPIENAYRLCELTDIWQSSDMNCIRNGRREAVQNAWQYLINTIHIIFSCSTSRPCRHTPSDFTVSMLTFSFYRFLEIRARLSISFSTFTIATKCRFTRGLKFSRW